MRSILLGLALTLCVVNISAADYTFDIFFESLCPYSRKFIWSSFAQFTKAVYANNLQDEVFEEVNINLYAYGLVTQDSQGNDQCQHGPNECGANRVLGCVKSLYANGQTQQSYFKFIDCYTHYIARFYEGPYNTTQYCVQGNPQLNAAKIITCAKGADGNTAFHQAGAQQQALAPDLRYVPYVKLNGKHNLKYETYARKSFLRTYCTLRAMDRKPKSVLCNAANLKKYGLPPKARRLHKHAMLRLKA